MAEKQKNSPERMVEAEILKWTSVAGMFLHPGTRHSLPISLAKGLRDQGLARPVPKVVESHPAPPPPPPATFDGEGDSDGDETESAKDDSTEEGGE